MESGADEGGSADAVAVVSQHRAEAQRGEPDRERLTGSLRRGSVKKHVAAIHISGRLTLLQRKLSNVLLLNAYDELGRRASFEIDARTLADLTGYNSNDHETLKASLRGLVETVAEWDMLDERGRQEWGVSSLLGFATLKGGVCRYGYSPALAEKLADPKVFALIDLKIMRRFASGHALALYENCYRFIATSSTGWWPLDTFRRLMGVDGSPYYEAFKHLNAKIIKPAVAEVNRSSNIVVTAHTRKRGRNVTDIRFAIARNPQLAILDLDDGAGLRHSPVHARLTRLGVGDRLARQWLTEHGEAAVAARLDRVAAQEEVRDPARYLSAVMRREGAGQGAGGQGRAPEAAPSEATQVPRPRAGAHPGDRGCAQPDAAGCGPQALRIADPGGGRARLLRPAWLDVAAQPRGDRGVPGGDGARRRDGGGGVGGPGRPNGPRVSSVMHVRPA